MDANHQQQSQQQGGQQKKKKSKGLGCLIAIVVVFFGIIFLGILAAVAIPGFMAYIKASKTQEAKTNLKALANGALVYMENNEKLPEMPQGTRIGPVVDQTTIGLKSMPNSADFENTPWKELRFVISTPHYYSYFYSTKSTPSGTVAQITASASLTDACDSVFYIIIDDKGVTSPRLPGDASLCNPLGIVQVY